MKCPINTEVQTILFSRDYFNNPAECRKWLRGHGYKCPKVDITENYYRFRQKDPKKFQFGSFRTIKFDDGIKAIIGCPMATKRKNSAVFDLESDLSMQVAKRGIKSTNRNEMKKVFGNTALQLDDYANPIHIPKTTRGRPSKAEWWILDLFDSKKSKITTHIGKGSKKGAEYEAASMIGHRARGRGRSRIVKSAMLSGPYTRKPTAKTKRK